MSDDIFAELRAGVEKRVREQLQRHLKIDPNAELSRIVEIQIGQEREKLERMCEKFEDEGQDKFAEFTRILIEDWLPMLSKDLKAH